MSPQAKRKLYLARRSAATAVAASVGLVVLMAPAAARAYVDPGSGSLVLQGIIAAIVGAGVGVKVFWRRIRRLIGGRRPGGDGRDAGS